jgi:hypothetical protein
VIQNFSDSKLVIDWANNKNQVNNLDLGPIKRAREELKRNFEFTTLAKK